MPIYYDVAGTVFGCAARPASLGSLAIETLGPDGVQA